MNYIKPGVTYRCVYACARVRRCDKAWGMCRVWDATSYSDRGMKVVSEGYPRLVVLSEPVSPLDRWTVGRGTFEPAVSLSCQPSIRAGESGLKGCRDLHSWEPAPYLVSGRWRRTWARVRHETYVYHTKHQYEYAFSYIDVRQLFRGGTFKLGTGVRDSVSHLVTLVVHRYVGPLATSVPVSRAGMQTTRRVRHASFLGISSKINVI